MPAACRKIDQDAVIVPVDFMAVEMAAPTIPFERPDAKHPAAVEPAAILEMVQEIGVIGFLRQLSDDLW